MVKNLKPTLVFAMEEEAAGAFAGFDCLYTGIGKVNAAYALTRRLYDDRPQLVVNLGTAGSRKHAGGSVINCTSFVQRDMDVTPLGVELYKTPFSDDPIIFEYGHTVTGLVQGVCGSGDSFDTSERACEFDVVDMEAYALALVCKREEIPFLCLKYVSDGADDKAHIDWNDMLKNAAQALHMSLQNWMEV